MKNKIPKALLRRAKQQIRTINFLFKWNERVQLTRGRTFEKCLFEFFSIWNDLRMFHRRFVNWNWAFWQQRTLASIIRSEWATIEKKKQKLNANSIAQRFDSLFHHFCSFIVIVLERNTLKAEQRQYGCRQRSKETAWNSWTLVIWRTIGSRSFFQQNYFFIEPFRMNFIHCTLDLMVRVTRLNECALSANLITHCWMPHQNVH